MTFNLVDITVGHLELTKTGRPRLIRLRMLGRPVMALARAATLLVAFAATRAYAADIGYLAPPGVAANEFPSVQRPVAQIVSPRRSTEEHRDALNEAGQIARLLELKPGMTVGDIGAGSGYHTVRLSHLVGPAGSVVAQDVTRDYLIELARRTKLLKLTNVKFALGEPHDPRLPASSLDAAILVHMYHEIAQPYAFLYNLTPALKRGARVGIVDLELPTSEHGTPIELLRCELTAVGYRAVATYKLAGGSGYLAVFSPPEGAGRKSPRDIVACGDRAGRADQVAPAGELLHEPSRLFVFVGFSDDRRLALVVRFGVVAFVLVIIIVIVIVIVGVSRRHRVAHDGDESPLGRGKVLRDALGHGRLLAGCRDIHARML